MDETYSHSIGIRNFNYDKKALEKVTPARDVKHPSRSASVPVDTQRTSFVTFFRRSCKNPTEHPAQVTFQESCYYGFFKNGSTEIRKISFRPVKMHSAGF